MESEVLKSSIALILALVVPTALAMFSLRYPPSWKDNGPLAPFWSKINLISLAASVVLAVLTFILYSSHITDYRFIATLSTALLTFVVGQTLFTDFTQRLADRRILNMANLVSLAAGLWFLNKYEPQTIPIYLVYAIVGVAVMFVPSIGDSDGRAITLVVLSAFPIVGAGGMQWGIIGFLAALLIYTFATAIRAKSFKVGFISRMSIPLVPLVIAPFLIIVILAAVLPIRIT